MVDFVPRNTGIPKKPKKLKLLGPIIKIYAEFDVILTVHRR